MIFLTGIFNNFISFIRLVILGIKSQYKSILGLAASSVAAPLAVAAVIIAAGPALSGAFPQMKLELIFCDLEGSAYFDTILNLLLSDESITKTANVRKLGYDEALQALGEGRADAVIVFPEAFISDMSRGINKPITIYGSERDPVRTVFIKEFMQSAADQLSAAQSAINTVWFNIDTEKLSGMRRTMVFTSLTLEYTSKAFARGANYAFRNVELPHESRSLAAYLTASALAALIFFGALSGVKQIQSERRTGITTRLAASGASSARTAFIHFIPVYSKQLLCACFAVLIALPAVALAESAAERSAAAVTAAAGKNGAQGSANADSVIGGIIQSAIESGGTAINNGAEITGGDGGGDRAGEQGGEGGGAPDSSDNGGLPGDSGAGLISFSDFLDAAADSENARRFADTLPVLCALCLFTSSLTLFLGYMLERSEPAGVIIVSSGIVMAIAGGTVIPYPFMPDAIRRFGPYCFNKWAQRMIAASLFGGGGRAGGETLLTINIASVFLAISAALVAATIIKIRRERA